MTLANRRPVRANAPWGWAALGAGLGLLVATVVFAPAQWLASAVHQGSGQRVDLVGARGSVWDGSAQLVLSGGPGSGTGATLPGQVQWRIRPAWSGLRLALRADCCAPQPLELQAHANGLKALSLTLGDGQTRWPAGLLTGLGTPWNTLQLQGQLEARTQGVALEWTPNGLALAGRLQVDALRVSSRLSTLSPMGSYRVTVEGGPTTALQVGTLDGSLQLTGQGEWLGQRLRFNGVASAAPERVEALSNLLNIVGRRDGARSLITLG